MKSGCLTWMFLFCSVAAMAQSGTEVEILFAGDLMQHTSQLDAARRYDDSYDYSHAWRYVKKDIESADIAIGNLETPLGYSEYAGYPRFKAPVAYITAAADAGFDVMLLANNHIYDHYRTGVRQTLDILDSVGMKHTGAWRDTLSHEKNRILMLEDKGIRFAVLNYTYGTNIPSASPVVVNHRDSLRIEEDVRRAEKEKADVVIACIHWGVEYDSIPSSVQTDYAGYMINSGVDVVVGTHPHVVQPMYEIRDSRGEIKHVVAYSLGNFFSGQRTISTQGGATLRVKFSRGADGKVRITDSACSLVWVRRYTDTDGREKFAILPLHRAKAGEYDLSPVERYRMNTFSDMVDTLFEKTKVNIKKYIY